MSMELQSHRARGILPGGNLQYGGQKGEGLKETIGPGCLLVVSNYGKSSICGN